MEDTLFEARPVFAPAGPAYENHLVFDRAFSRDECDQIIALGTALPTETGRLHDTAVDDGAADDGAGADDATVRAAAVAWIPPDDQSDWVYRRLGALAEAANERYAFELTGFFEDLQYTVYDRVGAFYTWHQDGLDTDVATRKLTLVVQLSDPADYEGANLEFLDVALDWPASERRSWATRTRRRGTVLAFPAFEHHRVVPLETGQRHSLVCWVSGPAFR